MQASRRTVAGLVDRVKATEGAGVSINRIMPTAEFEMLDPFLLLDEIRSDDPSAYLAGFPPHPHRGIETVTYMLAGRMHHRDSTGGDGVIGAGDVQWMTAGSGIIHSEMPEQANGLMWGFQLWINLPAAEKMATSSRYVELAADRIPVVAEAGCSVRVIAGDHAGHAGPAPRRTTEPLLLDVAIDAGAAISIPVPLGHSAFIYCFQGIADVAGTRALTGQTAILEGEGSVLIASLAGARLMVGAGRPLREPVHRAGPFVMASERDLARAFEDYRSGRFLETA
jgi:redox-sensitive bicupin YhaK (pirin superfamily)